MKLRSSGDMAFNNGSKTELDLTSLVLSDGEITVRPACAADDEQLFAWLTDPEVYRWWGGEPKTREDAARHATVMAGDDGVAWPFIVLRRDEAMGYLQVWRDNDGKAGLDMFLSPAFRGHGYGARAANAMARYLTDAGSSQLTADPAVDNERAVRMWQKAGFEKSGAVIDTSEGPCELMVFRGGKGTGTESPWT